jgi:hypothetical protein
MAASDFIHQRAGCHPDPAWGMVAIGSGSHVDLNARTTLPTTAGGTPALRLYVAVTL